VSTFCPICGGEGIPLAPDDGRVFADPAARIIGPCPECGGTVPQLQEAARAMPEWADSTRPSYSGSRLLAVYAGIIIGCLAIAFAGEALTGIDGRRLVIGALGSVFLIAATGRPSVFFETVRNMGWFRSIRSDTAIRILLVLLGLLLIGVMAFVHPQQH
jgi:hypothetical protein